MSSINFKHFTLGVEEEYMVIDPQSRELKSHQQKIVTEGQKVIKDKVKAEMHQAVVEVGTDICQNIDEAITVASNNDNNEIFFIGGGSVYKQTIELADKLYLTIVDEEVEADTFFPDYAEFDKKVSESKILCENNIKYKFLELEKQC